MGEAQKGQNWAVGFPLGFLHTGQAMGCGEEDCVATVPPQKQQNWLPAGFSRWQLPQSSALPAWTAAAEEAGAL